MLDLKLASDTFSGMESLLDHLFVLGSLDHWSIFFILFVLISLVFGSNYETYILKEWGSSHSLFFGSCYYHILQIVALVFNSILLYNVRKQSLEGIQILQMMEK